MKLSQAKICIVTTRNIFDSPCLEKYKSLLDVPFDIIYWDRCGLDEKCGALNYFKYTGILKPGAKKPQKLMKYIGFVRFVKKILKQHAYEKLIVFPTQMGWLIKRELCGSYKGRYLFDIQDYAGENKGLIYRMTKRVVESAGLCSITSPAYRSFLPEREYLISHNTQPIDEESIKQYRARKRLAGQPIVLSFIGSVRFIEQQKKLLTLFRNDSRFQLRFIGSGSEQLQEFCQIQKIENVTLIGRFERHELQGFYMETDMAINVYGNNDPYLDYALSNKLYSAAMLGMPILVSPKTYMAEISEKYGFGCSVDPEDSSAPDKVYSYFHNIDREKLFFACDAFMATVEEDEKRYTAEAREYFAEV